MAKVPSWRNFLTNCRSKGIPAALLRPLSLAFSGRDRGHCQGRGLELRAEGRVGKNIRRIGRKTLKSLKTGKEMETKDP